MDFHWHFSEVKNRFLQAVLEDGGWPSQKPLHSQPWYVGQDYADSWVGGSVNDTVGWIRNGYFAEEFEHSVAQHHNIAQTQIVWNDEEGDPDHTRMVCGYDDIFLGCIQAPSQSGVKIVIDYCFNANVDVKTIREYGGFCAALINSLMESGFDVEVDVRCRGKEAFVGESGEQNHYLRVKEFGEILDFAEFSVLFAPTAMRHLFFTVIGMGGDKAGKRVAGSLGYAVYSGWNLTFDETYRVITLGCSSEAFPAGKMIEQAQEAGVM